MHPITDAEKFREFDKLQTIAGTFGLHLKLDETNGPTSPRFGLWVRLIPKGQLHADQKICHDGEGEEITEVVVRNFDYLEEVSLYFKALADLRQRSDIDFIDALQPWKLCGG
jgi:hypothetical protein